MVDAFSVSDRTGTAITGTTSQSLLGTTITLPQTAMGIDAVFTASWTGTYLNHPAVAAPHDLDLDFVVNGTVVHRLRTYSIASNSLTRTVTGDYEITLTEADTAIIKGHGVVSAAGNTGQDFRTQTTTAAGVAWDQATDADIDIRGTLSLLADLPTHSLTPVLFRMATQETVTIIINETTGSGGGGPGLVTIEPGDIGLEDLPAGSMVYVDWGGTAYAARPTLVGTTAHRVVYTGPVAPNGVNSPGGPGPSDLWFDTSGA